MEYRLQVLVGGSLALDWLAIELGPADKREAVVTLPSEVSGLSSPGPVDAVLYHSSRASTATVPGVATGAGRAPVSAHAAG
jgi:hypothetical protein